MKTIADFLGKKQLPSYFSMPGMPLGRHQQKKEKLTQVETIQLVKLCVQMVTGVSIEMQLLNSRSPKYVRARQLGMYYLVNYFEKKITLKMIGKHYRGIDHSTVSHNNNKIKNASLVDKSDINALIKGIDDAYNHMIKLVLPVERLWKWYKINNFNNCHDQDLQTNFEMKEVYNRLI